MWFDVQAALKEIEGGHAATLATSATNDPITTNIQRNVANVASVATLSPAQNTAPDTPDLSRRQDSLETELFEERAAIAEYDGGLTRADAEHLAAEGQGYDNVVAFRGAQQSKQGNGNGNDR